MIFLTIRVVVASLQTILLFEEGKTLMVILKVELSDNKVEVEGHRMEVVRCHRMRTKTSSQS